MQRLEQRFFKTSEGLAMKWILVDVCPPRSEEEAATEAEVDAPDAGDLLPLCA